MKQDFKKSTATAGMKIGDNVTLTFYGVAKNATVSRLQTSSIVFVRFDGETRERWFHETSLVVRT